MNSFRDLALGLRELESYQRRLVESTCKTAGNMISVWRRSAPSGQ